ncbi:MAG: TonB-dependent receptor [Rhodospirillaceae bacterium]|nr:TonB-dependent receptor [Rhodospirillaceae bacterium]
MESNQRRAITGVMRVVRTCAVVVAGVPALAQTPPPYIEQIVVSATRMPQALKRLGSAVDVLTPEDIAARPRFLAADLLRQIPGVAVSQTGPLGTLTQVRMRGAEGNHTLVLIDGLEAGDPFNNSEYDFSTLAAADVARVEVLRGPQSALYGSEAIGGVINITTAGTDDASSISARAEGGAHDTWSGSVRAAVAGEQARGHVAVTGLTSAGISQARIGRERDGHRNVAISGGGRLTMSDNAEATVTARYVSNRTELDTQDFTFGSATQGLAVDSNDVRTGRTFAARAQLSAKAWEDRWTNALSGAVTHARGRNLLGTQFSSGSSGRKIDVEYLSAVDIGEAGGVAHALTGLVEYEDETFKNWSAFPGPQNQTRDTESWSAAAEYRVTVRDQISLTGALRHDGHELFRNATTYRVTSAWQAPGTGLKLRASLGTGVAKPSFFEMFGFNPATFIGNPALQPEKSTGWDVGADLALDGRGAGNAVLSVSYFKADLEDEIFTDFSRLPFTPRNRPGESRRQGVELSARWAPMTTLSLSAAYTYTDAVEDTGRREVRRPKHVGGVTAVGTLLDGRARVGLSLDYNGKQDDAEFIFATPTDRVSLDAYVLGTLSAAYQLTSGVELIGRVENLFDESYEQVFSYNNPGLGAYLGVRLAFGG